MPAPNKEETEELKGLLLEKKELRAIKRYREITGEGYQEAKSWIKTLKEENPDDFPSVLGGCGAMITLLLAVGIASVAAGATWIA